MRLESLFGLKTIIILILMAHAASWEVLALISFRTGFNIGGTAGPDVKMPSRMAKLAVLVDAQ